MASEETRLWIKAMIALEADIEAEVACPHCGQAPLCAEDLFYEGAKSERRLYCKECAAQNDILYARTPAPS